MLSVLGLFFDIIGFGILFFNGNFNRNFNRLQGIVISSGDEKSPGGMRGIESDEAMPKVLEWLGFGMILLGFVFQFIGQIYVLWGHNV